MTAKAKFVKGTTESQLLYMLGVPYGILRVEGYGPVLIDDHDGAMGVLSELVQAELVTADEAMALETAIVEAKLDSSVATFNKARDFKIEFGFSPSFNFEICAHADCPNPLAHGYIYDVDKMNVTQGVISTLAEGFNLCGDLAQLGGTNKLDAVRIFQQMLAANLPANKTEWNKRYDALPEETRRQAEEKSAKHVGQAIADLLQRVLRDKD